jgi:hypothetical protein
MYRSAPDSGLGWSLTPPSWLTSLIGRATGAVQSANTAVSQAQQITDAARRITAPAPAPEAPASFASGGVPGWVWPVGALAVAALVLSRRR